MGPLALVTFMELSQRFLMTSSPVPSVLEQSWNFKVNFYVLITKPENFGIKVDDREFTAIGLWYLRVFSF